MIELLQDFPDNVVAFVAKGRVSRADYDSVLVPAVEKALKRLEKVRLYYELGAEFQGIDAGAAWEDFVVGVNHWLRWERAAVVTDVDWIRYSFNVFRFLMPAQVRVFPTAEAVEARKWIAA